MENYNNSDLEEHSKIIRNILNVHKKDLLPINHIAFLEKNSSLFSPKVAYDIGSAVLHWHRVVKRLHPDCRIICFDANPDMEFLYKKHNVEYQIALLSDTDYLKLKYYYNRELFGGNSYKRELGYDGSGRHFPEDRFLIRETRTLDSLVEEFNYPMADLIKIDIQGAELDVLKGATNVLKYCKYLILELQEMDYNQHAPKAHEVVEYLKTIGYLEIAHKFSDNGCDYDSCFINTKLIN